MSSPVLLLAGGGLARETAEAARAAGHRVIGCLDDDPATHGTELLPGVPVLGGLNLVADRPDAAFVVCAGKGGTRRAIVERLTALGIAADRYATVIHPSVYVPASCQVGPGSVVLAGTVLTASVVVGAHVVCMPQVVLTHDDLVEDFATLCAGVVFGGSVRVGEAAYLGMAASVREGTTVGAGALVGMGAVVLNDVDEGTCVIGAPARRRVP